MTYMTGSVGIPMNQLKTQNYGSSSNYIILFWNDLFLDHPTESRWGSLVVGVMSMFSGENKKPSVTHVNIGHGIVNE